MSRCYRLVFAVLLGAVGACSGAGSPEPASAERPATVTVAAPTAAARKEPAAPPATAAPARVGTEIELELMIVVDLSASMQAEIEPQTTRLEATRAALHDLVKRQRAARIGLVVFGRHALVVSPLTEDLSWIEEKILALELGMIDGSATATGDGLAHAVGRLRHGDALRRVVLLVTDGDANAGSISPERAAELLREFQVTLHAVAIGSDEPVGIAAGTDLFGRAVRTRRRLPFAPEKLRPLVQTTGGHLYIVRTLPQLREAFEQLDRALLGPVGGRKTPSRSSGDAPHHFIISPSQPRTRGRSSSFHHFAVRTVRKCKASPALQGTRSR